MHRLAISLLVMVSLIAVAATADEPFGKQPVSVRVVEEDFTDEIKRTSVQNR